MTNAQIITQASKEVTNLAAEIDALVDKYLKESKMEANQRIVNVGRALNAYHIGWVSSVSGQLDKMNDEILLVSPNKKPGAFIKPSLGALEKKK